MFFHRVDKPVLLGGAPPAPELLDRQQPVPDRVILFGTKPTYRQRARLLNPITSQAVFIRPLAEPLILVDTGIMGDQNIDGVLLDQSIFPGDLWKGPGFHIVQQRLGFRMLLDPGDSVEFLVIGRDEFGVIQHHALLAMAFMSSILVTCAACS